MELSKRSDGMMDMGLELFTADYINDIATFSDLWEDHIYHIREVM